MLNEMVGGWTKFMDLNEDDEDLFDAVVGGLTGVNYVPLGVKKQVVSGENYCFICKGTVIVEEPYIKFTQIYIYKPLTGKPHITDMVNI